MPEIREEINQSVKKAVEEKLNLKNGECETCACGQYRKPDSKFYYQQNEGKYKCFHQNKCPIPQEGNYHTLNEELKIVNKEEVKKQARKSKGYDETPTWIYYDENGKPLYGKYRGSLKDRTTGEKVKFYYPVIQIDNQWKFIRKKIENNLPHPFYEEWHETFQKIPKVPYNLPFFKSAKYLWIVEGEKCADELQKHLNTACELNTELNGITLKPGEHVVSTLYSTGSFNEYYANILSKYDFEKIINIPDNDMAGFKHSRKIHEGLQNTKYKEKIIHIQIPNIAPSEDIYDFLQKPGADVLQIVQFASEPPIEVNSHIPWLKSDFNFPKSNTENKDQFHDKYYEMNEVGNRERFLDYFGDQLIHVKGLGWHRWNEKYWEYIEDGSQVKELIIDSLKYIKNLYESIDSEILLIESNSEMDGKEKKKRIKGIEQKRNRIMAFYDKSMSSYHIESIMKLTSSHPRVYRKQEILNARKDMLNVWNGVIDLKTGYLLPHDKRYYFTHCVNIDFPRLHQGLPAPRHAWNDYLSSTLVDEKGETDKDLIEYVQTQVGYFLTGEMHQQAIFFLSGSGANGKTTFIKIIEKLLGDYAKTMNPDALMQTNNRSPINNDIARTYDARAIISPEVEEGSAWNLGLVKAISGGDTISARFLRKEFFDFKPVSKLLVYGNYQPYLKGLDEGTKRRFKIIPFYARFTDKTRKDNLDEMLHDELPGILQWAVQGSIRFYEHLKKNQRIAMPKTVKNATEKYFAENDPVLAFLDDYFGENGLYDQTNLFDSEDKVEKKLLYSKYTQFCKDSGKHPMSRDKFSRTLTQRGIQSKRESTGQRQYVFYGLIAAAKAMVQKLQHDTGLEIDKVELN